MHECDRRNTRPIEPSAAESTAELDVVPPTLRGERSVKEAKAGPRLKLMHGFKIEQMQVRLAIRLSKLESTPLAT